MSWQRPNIGSRMNREVHVRFWERAEVKFLRATRQNRSSDDVRRTTALTSQADVVTARCDVASWQFGIVIAFDWLRWASGAAPRINRGSITDALGGKRADRRRWNVRDVARRGAQAHRDQLRDCRNPARTDGAGDRDIASRAGFTGIADCGRAGSMHIAWLRIFLFQGLRRDG